MDPTELANAVLPYLMCRHPGLIFDGYRERISARFERVGADPGEGGDAGRTIARVWAVTMAAIAERSALAGRVLAVLAYLAPDDIPEDILSPLAGDRSTSTTPWRYSPRTA